MRRNRLAPVERFYDSIAALSRRQVFFANYGIADTFEGRFELLALHLALVLRRLADLPAPAGELAQDLTDLAFRRLDQGLREIGIGDMGVPKRMKALAKAFYGRAAAYHAAFAARDHAQLVEALRRNVFGGGEGDAEGLAAHAEMVEGRLARLDLEAILASGLDSLESGVLR
ncbi:MAG: ubiquinol-cytochrome C chaperone family protein [Hyphomicrobiales bacterium]